MSAGFFATDVRRESACPVHFVWDGNGVGRPFVRIGFLGALLAGGLGSLGVAVHEAALVQAAGHVGFVAGGLWCTGQLLTRLARRR
jgi:hypothetical protein